MFDRACACVPCGGDNGHHVSCGIRGISEGHLKPDPCAFMAYFATLLLMWPDTNDGAPADYGLKTNARMRLSPPSISDPASVFFKSD